MGDKRKHTGLGWTCSDCGKSWEDKPDCKKAERALHIREEVED